MKTVIPLFLLFCLSQSLLGQECTRLNDIIQTQNNDRTEASYVSAGQSWVAPCSGQIESIAVRTQFVISTVQARIFIIEGTPTNLIDIIKDFNYTFQSNFNVGRQFIIDIPDLLDVTAGVEYSFVIVQDDSDNSIALQFSDNNPYANGNYRYQVNPGDSWVSVPSSDLDFDILVKDDPPTINCRDITLTLDENGEASTTFNALTTSSGDDLGVAIRTISQTDFTCADLGDNQVTLVIQDTGGQTSACQAIVTVEDDTPVQRGSCFGNLNYGANTENCGYVFTYDPATFFSDNCDLTIERTSGLASGSEFPLGTTTVTHVATDNNGNTATCSFNVEIRDELAPIVTSGDLSFSADAGTCSYTYTYDPSTFFSDTCDSNLTIARTEGLPSGSQFPLGQTLITHTATDAAGNVAMSSFYVTVTDDEAPTVMCPNDIAVGVSDSETSAVVSYNLPTFSDNCSATANISITQTAGLASGSSFPLGETTNTFQVEDEAGNINECSFTVTVSTPETSVDLTNGALTITDIGGETSDDEIAFSSDGTTLTISNLTSPVEVAGGPTLSDATTVTVPLADITAGITFEAQGGTNGITFTNDLSLNGTTNNITINNITNYTQPGAIDIEGIFTISNSANADIVLDELAATGLSITGVNSIDDVNNGNIAINGDTTLQSTGTLTIDKTINGSHSFGGLVNLEGSQITFIGQGTLTNFGTVTTTDGTAGVVNLLRIRSGAINLTGAVQTAGASELALISFSNITQSSSSSITTEVLTLSKSGNFTAGTNDIKLLESAENTDLGFVFLTDINDIEIGRLSTDDFNITATTIFISENTELTQAGSGTSNFNGNIDVTSSSATGSAIINHNAGTINFTGADVNLIGRLEYNGAANSITNLIGDDISLPFGGPGVSLTFGYLNVEGPIFFGDTFFTILNEARLSGNTTIMRGIGTLGTAKTFVENGATIQPGISGSFFGTLRTSDLEINAATFAPIIESNTSNDDIEVEGILTLTNATFSPVGAFTSTPTADEIVLILNDDTDAIVGTFENYPEGSGIIISGYGFTITYEGGDGNDVALMLDTENPTAICQDITVTVTPDADVTVNASDIDNGSSDNTGINQLLIEGSSSIAFTFADIGSYDVTLTVSDANGNSAQCAATVHVVSGINNTLPVLINEYEPTLSGVTEQTFEILGTPGETFAGYIVVVEGDVDSASIGVVRSAELISGTFDSNGLFTDTIPLIITPSHTVILTNSFTGTVNVTDVDPNDGESSKQSTDFSTFGQIYDALGVVDEDLDVGNTYGAELGGVDIANISDLARLAFRDALTGDWYVTNDSGNIFDASANTVPSSDFNTDPTAGDTFGSVNPFITPTETTVDLTNGTLTITDVNGGTSDDDITLSSDGTTLTISNLTGTVAVSGGPTLNNATTVTVPIASITNGIIFNAEDGTNGINFATALALTGVDNDITLNNITNYTHTGAIDIGGIFTIADSPNADIVFDALTATGLSVTNVNSIADNTIGSTSIFRIEGDTTLQAINTIVMDDANGSSGSGNSVSFAGNVTLEASRITFVAFGNATYFKDITATDATLGVNSIRIRSGNINFRGTVQTAGVSQLQLDAFGNINENDEATITTDVLTLNGRNNGSTRAILDGDNDIRVLENIVSFNTVTYNDINDVIIGNLTVTEFDITTPSGTIFLTEETILTKTGADKSYLAGDIEVDSNSTNPVINHDAGTITCTGANMSLFGNLTYNGLAGTTTEFLSSDTDLSTTDITLGGSTASLTFGNLNVTGVFFAIPQTSITIENSATFTGISTALQGFSTSSITGGPITITNGALLQPGNDQTTSSLITDDVTIDGGSFAPHINSGTDYSFVTVQGAVTLNNATFAPVGDFITLPNNNELILIDNDDTDAIVGTFLNYPEGSSIEVGGIPFTISYVGGDGNDFSLMKNTESPFITTWQTTTANESITIPTFLGETYDYIVDWGDGDVDYGITGDATHTYATAGTYTVSIFGTFSRIVFDGNSSENREKLLTIEQWGDNPWTSFEFSFTDCANMDMIATDIPDLSNVTSLRSMFDGCQSLIANASINNWDVSTIEDMSFLFNVANNFNQPLNNWNVSNVTTMAFMFSSAGSFNQPINNWNVSNVISFSAMFDEADSFNQPLNDWNVSNAQSMSAMFRRTDSFNQPLNNWNVSSVQNMTFMFRDASAFDQPLGNWDVSNIQSAVLLLTGSAFSDTNYDDLLINWSQLNLQSGVSFATDATYCLGATARQRMITNNNWVIIDGGSNCSVVLSPKVYLQGAYVNPNTGEESLMRDDLRVAGLVPTTSPYTDGLTCEATVFDATGANAIVDWVWVELRDATDNTFVITAQSALLQRDGDLVTTDGTSALSFDTSDGNYYISVQHRNHLGIMSSNAIALNGTTTTVDFTDQSTATFGTNAQTTYGMPTGVYGMWAGDANDDAEVIFLNTGAESVEIKQLVLDRSAAESPFGASVFYRPAGYYAEDVNMDGEVIFLNAGNELIYIKDNILAHPDNQLFNSVFYTINSQLP